MDIAVGTGTQATDAPRLAAENARLRDLIRLLGRTGDGPAVASDGDPRVDALVAWACEATGARYGAIATFHLSGSPRRLFTHGVTVEDRERVRGLLDGDGPMRHDGRLLDGEVVRLSESWGQRESGGSSAQAPGARSLVAVPVRHAGATVAVLYLADKRDGSELSDEDIGLAKAAALAASAVLGDGSSLGDPEPTGLRLDTVLDALPIGVLVARAPDGAVELANREASRILGISLRRGDSRAGYEEAVVYRRPDGSRFPPEELPLRRALAEGATSRGVDVLLERSSGRRVPVLVDASPIRDAAGSVMAAVAVFGDITERHEVERLKADFLSTVSHDLRNPLSAIKGFSSTLLMPGGPRDLATVLEYVDSIDEEVDHMAELVGNLLDMSRIEARSMPMDPETCHLADIVGDAVRRIQRSRAGGRHAVVNDVPLELPHIYADYDQISRVVTNLLSNAIKYSPEGSRITIRARVDGDDRAHVVTEVQDEGVGIPPGEIDKIFDKFYRVTSHRGRSRPGSGLGLAICRATIQAHDGELWVESTLGKGSTFSFRLPAAVPGM